MELHHVAAAYGFNPFPFLPIAHSDRICEAVPSPPRAAADRSRGPRYMVWIGTMDNRPDSPAARRHPHPPCPQSRPDGVVGDVPSPYGGSRGRETGTRDRTVAMVPASCAWVARMTPWPRYHDYDTFHNSTFHPRTGGDASVGGPRRLSAGSGPDDFTSSSHLCHYTELLEYAFGYRSYTESLSVRLR